MQSTEHAYQLPIQLYYIKKFSRGALLSLDASRPKQKPSGILEQLKLPQCKASLIGRE